MVLVAPESPTLMWVPNSSDHLSPLVFGPLCGKTISPRAQELRNLLGTYGWKGFKQYATVYPLKESQVINTIWEPVLLMRNKGTCNQGRFWNVQLPRVAFESGMHKHHIIEIQAFSKTGFLLFLVMCIAPLLVTGGSTGRWVFFWRSESRRYSYIITCKVHLMFMFIYSKKKPIVIQPKAKAGIYTLHWEHVDTLLVHEKTPKWSFWSKYHRLTAPQKKMFPYTEHIFYVLCESVASHKLSSDARQKYRFRHVALYLKLSTVLNCQGSTTNPKNVSYRKLNETLFWTNINWKWALFGPTSVDLVEPERRWYKQLF